MCGIAGIIMKKTASRRLAEDLLLLRDAIQHRGPDENGTHTSSHAGFVNLRLAIVDIASGHQPMFSSDRKCGIVYNGEVYNHTELRRELEAAGFVFKTSSDTEVVLHAYEHWGEECFSRLNGMFVAAIWDERHDRVVLVRDRFGIKPLYIYEDQERLVFCSEIKGLLAVPGLDLGLDERGIQDYLTFRYIQAPFTMFRRIRRLEAGCLLRIENGNALQLRYAELSYDQDPNPRSQQDLEQQLREHLGRAVESQLMGEVPIGVLLSGGVDSSAVAYFVRQAGADLTTYNIGFPDLNEFEFSRAVAKSFGLRHVEITTTPQEFIERFDSVLTAIDEPLADPACFPLYRLCEEIKKEVTVVLSGEGGDELFAGYPQYEAVYFEDPPREEALPTFLRRSWYFEDASEYLVNPFIAPYPRRFGRYFERESRLNRMLSYDMHTWMPENLMMKADKILMAHSLEGRFPFLDLNLFDFAARLPESAKLPRPGAGKWILKQALRDRLPSIVLERPKMGFSVPVEAMLSALQSRVLGTFAGLRDSALADVLNIELMEKQVQGYYGGSGRLALQVWSWFILLAWYEKFALARTSSAGKRAVESSPLGLASAER